MRPTLFLLRILNVEKTALAFLLTFLLATNSLHALPSFDSLQSSALLLLILKPNPLDLTVDVKKYERQSTSKRKMSFHFSLLSFLNLDTALHQK